MKTLEEWVESEVRPVADRSLAWLSQHHFFRDPIRATCLDPRHFFAPADGVVLYARVVGPDEELLNLKGRPYSLRDALRDPAYDQRSLVIGTFMTFYDVHINRVPYSGRLSYRSLESITTSNLPMLDMEERLLTALRVEPESAGYLHHNQRVVNRVYSSALGQEYFVLQIADYDVDCIMPFNVRQNEPCFQGERFSQIRYGSQTDLIIPLSDRFVFTPTVPVGWHVEAGIDPIVTVEPVGRPTSRKDLP